jgi:putative peptide zinc metalloprotease protein
VGAQAAGLLVVRLGRLPPCPRLAEGTELIGRYPCSGFIEPRYLARRGDGQMVQLSRLVYVLATLVDGCRDVDELALALGAAIDRTVTSEQVVFLLDDKLRPAGLVACDTGADEPATRTPIRPDPLLMLKYRVPLVPERIVWAVAGVFRSLLPAPVVAATLAGLAVVDALVLTSGGLMQIPPAVRALTDQPALILLVLAVLLAVGVFHECGHAAACRYGGARPGAMGIGLYLVWPGFYSTVTDAYRLDRLDRLRVDLAGVYFNAVALTLIGTAYLVTGSPWLLVALVAIHIETMWQFLPSVRLDGYYVLSDLVGVPDLFARIGPILQSAPPWRRTHPRVAELKPWTRRIVAAWVTTTVAFLATWAGLFIAAAPQILPVVWAAMLGRLDAMATAIQTGHIAGVALGAVQFVLLVLPYAGLTLITVDLARRLCRAVRDHPVGRRAATPGGHLASTRPARATAGAAGEPARVTPRGDRAAMRRRAG